MRARSAFLMAKDFADEVEYACRCVERWLKHGIPAREIAVIYFKGIQGEVMSRYLTQVGVSHHWMSGKTAKKAYDPAADKGTVITAQSSKGLEFQSLVMIGVGTGGSQGSGEAALRRDVPRQAAARLDRVPAEFACRETGSTGASRSPGVREWHTWLAGRRPVTGVSPPAGSLVRPSGGSPIRTARVE